MESQNGWESLYRDIGARGGSGLIVLAFDITQVDSRTCFQVIL